MNILLVILGTVVSIFVCEMYKNFRVIIELEKSVVKKIFVTLILAVVLAICILVLIFLLIALNSNVITLVLGILISFLGVTTYALCVISSKCSRKEEEKERREI